MSLSLQLRDCVSKLDPKSVPGLLGCTEEDSVPGTKWRIHVALLFVCVCLFNCLRQPMRAKKFNWLEAVPVPESC